MFPHVEDDLQMKDEGKSEKVMNVDRKRCPAYNVTMSWDSASPDRDVKTAIRVDLRCTSPGLSTENLEDSIEAENCVLLRAKDSQGEERNPSPLELRFSLNPGARHAVSGFSVLSEARNLEVYDSLNEYVSTVRAVLVDRVDEDFVVYRCDVRLDRPLSNGCSVKFLSLRSPNEMWLYGGLFLLSPCDPSKSGPPTGFGPIVARMQEQDGGTAHLSDNARRFAKLVSAVSSDNAASASLPMLMSMLGVGPSRVAGSNRPPSVVSDKPHTVEGRRPDTSNGSLNSVNGSFHLAVSLLEERLWSKIEARLDAQEKRQNEKLDVIIELLKNGVVSSTLPKEQTDHPPQASDPVTS